MLALCVRKPNKVTPNKVELPSAAAGSPRAGRRGAAKAGAAKANPGIVSWALPGVGTVHDRVGGPWSRHQFSRGVIAYGVIAEDRPHRRADAGEPLVR